jgi:hypothetical protein
MPTGGYGGNNPNKTNRNRRKRQRRRANGRRRNGSNAVALHGGKRPDIIYLTKPPTNKGVNRRLGSRRYKVMGDPRRDKNLKVHRFTAPLSRGATITTTPMGTIRIRNKEYVATVLGSTATAIATFIGQPGNSTTHPWLSPMAAMFEEYRYNNVFFEYIGTCGATATGTIVGYYEYDVNDDPQTSVATFAANDGAIETNVWNQRQRWHMKKSDLWLTGKNKFFTRVDGQVVTNLQNYDSFNFSILTTGQASAAQVGHLWINYDIEFKAPQTPITIMPGSYYATGATITNLSRYTQFSTYSPVVKNGNLSFIFNGYFTGQIIIFVTVATVIPGSTPWTLTPDSNVQLYDNISWYTTNTSACQVYNVIANQGGNLQVSVTSGYTFTAGSWQFYPNDWPYANSVPLGPQPIQLKDYKGAPRMVGTHPAFLGRSLNKMMRLAGDTQNDQFTQTYQPMMRTERLPRSMFIIDEQDHESIDDRQEAKEDSWDEIRDTPISRLVNRKTLKIDS